MHPCISMVALLLHRRWSKLFSLISSFNFHSDFWREWDPLKFNRNSPDYFPTRGKESLLISIQQFTRQYLKCIWYLHWKLVIFTSFLLPLILLLESLAHSHWFRPSPKSWTECWCWRWRARCTWPEAKPPEPFGRESSSPPSRTIRRTPGRRTRSLPSLWRFRIIIRSFHGRDQH